jgi:hypothetical protein
MMAASCYCTCFGGAKTFHCCRCHAVLEIGSAFTAADAMML